MNARSVVLIAVLAASLGCEGSGPEGSYPATEGTGRGDGGLGDGGLGGSGPNNAGLSDAGVTAAPKCLYDFGNPNQCRVCGKTTSCDAPKYNDTGNDTVTSSCCGLEWQMIVVDDFPDGVFGFHWQEALDYCDELELDGGGWRLPTLLELETLYSVLGVPPPAPEVTFPPSSTGFVDPNFACWSSSAVVGHDEAAWAYNFTKLSSTTAVKEADQFFARCIR